MSSLTKCSELLEALLEISPTAEIKFSSLRNALIHLQRTFGKELVSHCNEPDLSERPGRVADPLVIMLNHTRRIVLSKYADKKWGQATTALSVKQIVQLRKLRRNLMLSSIQEGVDMDSEDEEDVGLDDDGWPVSQDLELDGEAIEVEAALMDEDGFPLSQATSCSPPPVAKKLWHTKAEATAVFRWWLLFLVVFGSGCAMFRWWWLFLVVVVVAAVVVVVVTVFGCCWLLLFVVGCCCWWLLLVFGCCSYSTVTVQV